MAKTKKENTQQTKSVMAKSDDGTIQVTFTLPWAEVASAREAAVQQEAQKINVPGFRPGKAPLAKVMERIPVATLIEKTITHFYPQILKSIVEEHKVKPATYPRIEVIKVEEEVDWEIKATTCELPKIELGNYRGEILGLSKSKAIWTPGKPDEKDHQPSREEKEQEILKTLLEKIKIIIPKVLIEEEVNSRLSQLLERIEKLGLKLESYLTSVGKTPEKLREEYEIQAKNAIAIELILGEIGNQENINVSESQIEETIKAASADPELAKRFNTPEQKAVVKNILVRRAVLDSLVALI